MPIEKTDGAVLRKLDTGWDSIPREAIDSLSSSEAISMYILLATRPENWVIRKEWVKSRLGIGEERYKKGREELVSLGYWTSAEVRGDDGHVQGRLIWFNPVPPKYRKTELRENPNLGKTAPLKNKEVIKDKERVIRELPYSVNAEAWAEFVQHRKDIRKPLTELAETKNLNILAKLTFDQQQEVVDQTIANRWTGLFAPKEKTNAANRNAGSAADRVRAANAHHLN